MVASPRGRRRRRSSGTASGWPTLAAWLGKVTDGNRCYLAVEERIVVTSILDTFADEVAEHAALGRCPRPKVVPLPKLVDVADGVATYDQAVDRKLPDWTYMPG